LALESLLGDSSQLAPVKNKLCGADMILFQLDHQYWQINRDPEVKRLGYFSSLEKLYDTREMYLLLPGFCDHQEGFTIKRHIIDGLSNDGIFVLDFILDEFSDEYCELGIFQSIEAVLKRIEHFKSENGQDFQSGRFEYEEYKLDKMEWCEGFFTSTFDE